METRKKNSFGCSGTTAFPVLAFILLLSWCYFFPAQYRGNTKDTYLWCKQEEFGRIQSGKALQHYTITPSKWGFTVVCLSESFFAPLLQKIKSSNIFWIIIFISQWSLETSICGAVWHSLINLWWSFWKMQLIQILEIISASTVIIPAAQFPLNFRRGFFMENVMVVYWPSCSVWTNRSDFPFQRMKNIFCVWLGREWFVRA